MRFQRNFSYVSEVFRVEFREILKVFRVLAADGLLGKKRQRGLPANPTQVVAQAVGASDDRLRDEDEIEVIA